MAKRDYYEVLGLSRGASEQDIKTAFRRLAKDCHPDRNSGDKAAEQKFKELGDKVSAGDKGAIESAIASLKSATQGEDVNDIKAKLTALGQVSLKLGEAVYGGQPGAGGEAGGKQAGGGNDNVVDADFEEVKDDKKKSA